MESLVNQNLFNGFYKNKTVLITGNTGFKGAWLSLWLKLLGANIIGFSLKEPVASPSHFDLLKLSISAHHGNIQNKSEIDKIIIEHQPEVIFHMAAQSLVRYSYENPNETYLTNINGTINILDSIKTNLQSCCFINITSDKAYENRETLKGYVETDAMGGFDPYSASKGCSEIITSSYRRSFFHDNPKVKIASARAGNVIGGGDWAKDRIIPDLIRAIQQNVPISIRNPKSVRPWQHVLEPLSGYLLLGQQMGENKNEYSSAWNFGPNEAPTEVIEMVNKATTVFPGLKVEIETHQNNVHEASLLNLNCDKAKELLKWQPIWDLESTLNKTLEWYKNYYNNEKSTYEISTNDIIEYVAKANQLNLTWTNQQ